MAPSLVPAGQRGWQPGAQWNKQAGRKLLAGDQFPAHWSCSRRSWGCLAWAASPFRQDQGSFAGYREMREALGQPKASLPLHGVFAHCLPGLQLVQVKAQNLSVLLVLDEALDLE